MKDMMKQRSMGFPELLTFTQDKNYYYIVMEKLGSNLKELKE